MKKFFALLLSVVLMLSMLTPAMAAYTAITPGSQIVDTDGTTVLLEHGTTVSHSLKLTETDATSLLYNITYNFSVGSPVVIGAKDNGVSDAGNAVTGSPTIASITYGPSDVFSADNKTAYKNLLVNWQDVTINEPGVYRWTVSQSYTDDAPLAPSNASATFYLFMYVTDNAGKLNAQFIMSENETVGSEKNGTLDETYPAKTVDLTLSKIVDGNQASKDQYFPFTISLTAPGTTATTFSYTLSGKDYTIDVPATAYHDKQTNPTTVPVTDGKTGSFVVWLKHGQSVTISDMVYGTDYTITEGGNKGYTTSIAATGHTDGFTPNNMISTLNNVTAADSSLEGDVTVTYTNYKNTDVPTGIDMQSGAAFAGIILAMGLMIVMFISKRKEQAC